MKRTCENCCDSYELSDYHKRKMPELCCRCALIASNRKRVKKKINSESLVINKEQFTAVSSDRRVVPLTYKFVVKCVRCEEEYKAALGFERTKKHPWHCKACAIALEWQDVNYRKKHVDELRIAHNRPEEKKRVSEQSITRWRDATMRHRMTNVGRDRKIAACKGRKTIIANLLSGKTSLKIRHGKHEHFNNVYFRSTYETRFAKLLTGEKRKWTYEPCRFLLSDGKTYCPDFYLPDCDLYVEIKGWWRDDARQKFDMFLIEYSQLSIALVTIKELKLLESKELQLEACIVKEGWSTTRI